MKFTEKFEFDHKNEKYSNLRGVEINKTEKSFSTLGCAKYDEIDRSCCIISVQGSFFSESTDAFVIFSNFPEIENLNFGD